jgi:hypothetical protein
MAEIILRLVEARADKPWPVCVLSLGDDATYDIVLNPAYPHSIVGPETLADMLTRSGLSNEELCVRLGARRYLIRRLLLGGYPIADVPVRLSRVADLLGVGLVRGFDFFEQFDELRYRVRERIVTLMSS